MKAQKIDATTGKLWSSIVRYAIPLILGTLIQNCFNAIDLIVLGNLGDANDVASVGATTMIVSLVVNSFIGIVGGSKIILAHQFGSKDGKQIKASVDTSLLTALGIGLLVVILGVPFAPGILHMTNCPTECFDGAVTYIRIYVAAAPAILLYNFGSAVMTASGDSKRPLYYIIISGLTNVVFNIVLCIVMPKKVAAVAVSTFVSQIVGAFLVLNHLRKMEGDGKVEFRRMRFDKTAFVRIMAQGLPLALNTALYPLANLQIQSAINTFGVAAIAGNSASSTIEGIPGAFSGSFGSTTTVFVGQNLGAGQPKRAKRSFQYCLIINCVIGLVMGLGIWMSGSIWLGMFLPDNPEGIAYGLTRMIYVLGFYPIACVNSILGATIQTYGYALYTSVSSMLCVCGFRFIWMWFVYPHFERFDILMLCFTVSWSLLMLCYIVGYFLYVRRKNKELLAA